MTFYDPHSGERPSVTSRNHGARRQDRSADDPLIATGIANCRPAKTPITRRNQE